MNKMAKIKPSYTQPIPVAYLEAATQLSSHDQRSLCHIYVCQKANILSGRFSDQPCSDHIPLRKFLEKNILNSKVNSWIVKIFPFNIKFEYIKGIENILEDTMSRLIDIDSDIKLWPECKGNEYGCCIFL